MGSSINNTRITNTISTPEFNVERYGAAAGASYSTNKAALQNAFNAANAAGGGIVSITTPGVYEIAGRIVIYSNTEFHVGAGVIVRQASSAVRGENDRWLFANNAYVNNANVTISSITSSGRTCTVTTSTDHELAVGDWVVIHDVATDGYAGVHEVLTTPTSTTFTYLSHRPLAATPAVGLSGGDFATYGHDTMKMRKCDVNISITGHGTIDYDEANTPNAVTTLDTMGVIIAACHTVDVESAHIINTLKYNIYFSGVRNVSCTKMTTRGTSDGIHATGCCMDIDIKSTYMSGGDNNIGIGTTDYPNYNIFIGPMENIACYGIGQNKGLALRLFGSSEFYFRGIRFQDVRGGNNEQDLASLQLVTDAGCIGDGRPNIKDITYGGSASFSSVTGALTQVTITGTVELLVIENPSIQYPNSTYGRYVAVKNGAIVGTIIFSRGKIESGHSTVNIEAGGTLENIILDNMICSTRYCINNAANDAFNVIVSNSVLNNSSGSFRETSTTGKMTIKAVNTTCTTWLARTSTQTFVVDGHCARIDASWVDRTDGVMFYNTNAALGTLGKAGVVLGTGTGANSWVLLENTTLNY